MSKLSETLIAARQRRGERLDEVEQATRIRQAYLHALETDRFDRLPAPVYTRGFVRNYAIHLELDPREMGGLYDEAIGYRPEPIRLAASQRIEGGRLLTPNVTAISVALVLAAILFVWLYSAFFVVGPGNSAHLPTPAVPTPTTIVAVALATATPTTEPALPVASPGTTASAGLSRPPAPLLTPSPGAPAPGTAPPASSPAPILTSTATPTGLELKVKVVDAPSWVQIRADGVVVFTGTLASGTERTFNAKDEIFIHAGRSDAVELFLNGAPQGRLGRPGQSVVRRTFNRQALNRQAIAATGRARLRDAG